MASASVHGLFDRAPLSGWVTSVRSPNVFMRRSRRVNASWSPVTSADQWLLQPCGMTCSISSFEGSENIFIALVRIFSSTPLSTALRRGCLMLPYALIEGSSVMS